MEIGTSFFGTSDGAGPSPANPNGGAGWLDDTPSGARSGASDTQSPHFHPWHLVAGALAGQVAYGPTVTLGLGTVAAQDAAQLTAGDRVSVAYVTRAHALVAALVIGL